MTHQRPGGPNIDRWWSSSLVGAWSLDPKGPGAEAIAGLWWLMLALGVAVFVVFGALLAIGLFRRRPAATEPGGETSEGFSAWFIGAGLVAPLVIIAVVFVATVDAMRSVPTRMPAGALVVDVIGHQWWWEVRYPDEGVVTANELHLPVGRPVALRLASADVIHSFWVPELGGKLDLLPEDVNLLVVEADEPGEYTNRCAEFCGLQHTLMQMPVTAEPEAAFGAWVQDRREAAAEPAAADARRGRDIFLGSRCAECHTIRGTPATGTEGPDLTHLAGRPTLGAGAARNTPDRLAEWIADPHGLKRGVAMPPADLNASEVEAVVAYLETLE